jgi:SAM-dependent methyltransferase
VNERVLFRSCPLCDGPELADFAAGNCSAHPSYHDSLEGLIRWRQCARCAHVFTEGYYTDQACELIFAKTQEQQQAGFGIEQHRVTSARIVEKVLPYADHGTWLDIGFGNGSLLFTALEYGFTPVGLDLRADNVKTMCSLGIECYCMDISQLAVRSGCSVISMADVLEHLPYPKKALQAAHRLLSDEGILFVSMPNMESIVWAVLDQQNANPYWGEMEHYHNFGRTRLYALLFECGFEPVRYGISERYRVCMEVIAKKT